MYSPASRSVTSLRPATLIGSSKGRPQPFAHLVFRSPIAGVGGLFQLKLGPDARTSLAAGPADARLNI
jgi:hypothetical protein